MEAICLAAAAGLGRSELHLYIHPALDQVMVEQVRFRPYLVQEFFMPVVAVVGLITQTPLYTRPL
jgi:hypothetical protein